jgi:hypothetical protein
LSFVFIRLDRPEHGSFTAMCSSKHRKLVLARYRAERGALEFYAMKIFAHRAQVTGGGRGGGSLNPSRAGSAGAWARKNTR